MQQEYCKETSSIGLRQKKIDIHIGVTGSLLDSARPTMAGVLKANYGLFRSLERDIVRNA